MTKINKSVNMAKTNNKPQPGYLKTRTDYLARPNKYKISKKYTGEKPMKFKKIDHPVVPLNNERLNMLAEMPKFKQTTKYEIPRVPSTTIKRSVLNAVMRPRIDHLSKPFVLKLQGTKREYGKTLGLPFIENINEKILQSWDTIYYFNEKSLRAANADKKKKKVKPPKIWNPDKNRLGTLALPKKVQPPPKMEKRQKKAMKFLIKKIKQLSRPPSRRIYKRPSQDTFMKLQVDRLAGAGKYVTSTRMKKLALLPAHRLRKEPPPFFGVKKGALEAEMTERLEELSQPRARANAPEMDLKENPYDISPRALKYKATPRIIKLAKPVER